MGSPNDRARDLLAWEERFVAARNRPPELKSAFREGYATATREASGLDFALWRAGLALVDAVEAAHGASRLAYHNRHHFAEAVRAMGLLCGEACRQGALDPHDAALGVLAMVGHDLGHDGSADGSGALERAAAAASARICADAGVGPADGALLAFVIEGTDPALVADNEARLKGSLPPGPYGRRGDLLRSLANEADVFASLLPSLGFALGDALAEEMRGRPGVEAAGSCRARLAFLRRYRDGLSPAAAACGLPELVLAQIAALPRAAGRVDLTPEEAADALDALSPASARARCLDALRKVWRAGSRRGAFAVRVGLTFAILTAFSVVFVAVIGVTAVIAYRASIETALETALRAMADLTARTSARAEALVGPMHAAVAVMPRWLAAESAGGDGERRTETLLRDLLAALPQARAAAVVDAGGALLRIVDARDAPGSVAAPAGARWALERAAPSGRGVRLFLDEVGGVLERRETPERGDPREDIWARTARHADGVATTVVHPLDSLGVPGVSIVRRLDAGGAIGVDVPLATLGGFLADERISPRSSAFIIDDDGILIAHSDQASAAADAGRWTTIASAPDPILRAVWRSYAEGRLAAGRHLRLSLDGGDYLVRLAALARAGTPPPLVAVVAPIDDFTGAIERARDLTAMAFGGAGAVGLLVIFLIARQITRPLNDLRGEAEAIRRFRLDQPILVRSHLTEVADLAGTMEAMRRALATFAIYVPKALVRQLFIAESAPRLGGERRQISVMFSDIVGFTGISDTLDAAELMHVTTEYFEAMTRALMAAGGTVDKYIGDAVMALWNAPLRDEAHAAHACLAALRCRAVSERLAAEYPRRGWPALHTRFGISTGEAVIGNVGSSDRMSYTAIGPTVNLGSRLEGLNTHYGTSILVCESTRRAAGSNFVFRHIDRVMPKGRRTPTEIHELVGLRYALGADEALVVSSDEAARAEAFDRMTAAFQQRRFGEALDILRMLGSAREDRAVVLAERRIASHASAPPPEDWSGIAAFDEKVPREAAP